MKLKIVSFGIKHGIPEDASILLDCRGIRNPWDDRDLRHLRGTDAPVAEQVLAHELAPGLVHQAIDTVVYRHIGEGKQAFTLGIFCTAGRHRSVAIAEEVARRAEAIPGVDVWVLHRDKDKGGDHAQ